MSEEGNPRRSFDINVYKTGYRLRDLRPLLLKVIAHHGVAPGKFDSLYERDRFPQARGSE